jgi:hypothetical protein
MNVPNGGQVAVRERKQLQAMGHSPYQALIEKLEDLDVYAHKILHHFPRIERHVLCQSILECMERMFRLCVIAWKRKSKNSALFDLDVEVDVLRHHVRKAHRLRYITARRLGVWMGHIQELGRMVGGWIKHCDGKQKVKTPKN